MPDLSCDGDSAERKVEDMHEMDLANEKMRRHVVLFLQLAKLKVRIVLILMTFIERLRQKRNLLYSLASDFVWKWIVIFLIWRVLSLAINRRFQ